MKQLSGFFLALLVISVLPVQAKLYKWVDENGQTHFGDKIPAQYLHKEYRELNEQGATIKKTDALPTAEELIEIQRLAKIQKEEERIIKEGKKRDRVLLDTYTTERDLVIARDARLDAVGSQLQLSESIIKDVERKLKQTKSQVASIKAQGRDVPKNITDKITKDESQLSTYKKVAKGHRARKEKIAKQFDGYIKRFRELKNKSKKIKQARRAAR